MTVSRTPAARARSRRSGPPVPPSVSYATPTIVTPRPYLVPTEELDRQADLVRTPTPGTDDKEQLVARYALTRDAGQRDRAIEAYLPLAYRTARRFRHKGEPLDDLVQVAAMAMVKAVERFDPERGVRFSTYAVPTVVGELKRHFRDHAWSVRVPRRLKDLRVAIAPEVSQLEQLLGRSPTVPEIARRLGVSSDRVMEAIETSGAAHTEPLCPRDHEDEMAEIIDSVSVKDPTDHADDRDELMRLLGVLSDGERSIVYLRFFRDLSQSQIAECLGISQSTVSRIVHRSLVVLRQAAADAGAGAVA
jgi:RNA polymerase sigma-B factor